MSSSSNTTLTPKEIPSEVQTQRREGSFITLLGRHTQKHNFVFPVRTASEPEACNLLGSDLHPSVRNGDGAAPCSPSHPLPLPFSFWQ